MCLEVTPDLARSIADRIGTATKAFIPSPGFETPLGEDQARDRVRKDVETFIESDETGKVEETIAFLGAPPESEFGAAAEVVGMGIGGFIGKGGAKFADEGVEVIGKAADDVPWRQADDVASKAADDVKNVFRFGDDAARAGGRAADDGLSTLQKGGLLAGGGLAGYSLIDPEGARENTQEAANRASQAFGGLLGGATEGLLTGSAKSAAKAPLGFLVLIVGGAIALMVALGVLGGD